MGSFSFTRQERRGVLYVAIIVLLTIGFRYSMPYFIEKEEFNTASFENEIKQFENRQLVLTKEAEAKRKKFQKPKYVKYDKSSYKSYRKNKNAKYYNFDPNTAKLKDWKNFGFSEKQSKVIINYIKRAGGIKSKSELKNIFVIDERKYRELYPFIDIKEVKQNENSVKNIEIKNKIELNSATVSQLMSVKGIGRKTAERIIKYRKILGGFYSLTQLNEVYGISEENYMKMKLQLKVNRLGINKININFADKQELAHNPYISFEEAKKIIKFKVNNGAFKSVNDLFTNNLITNEKLRYYLTIE